MLDRGENISKDVYYKLLDMASKKIRLGGEQNYQEAEKILDELENWSPMRLEYICARIELIIKRGGDKKHCRNILNMSISEKFYQPVLSELFRVKQLTFESNSIEWEMCNYSISLYSNDTEKCTNYVYKLNLLREKILTNDSELSSDNIKKLAELYYITRDMTMYFILMLAWCKMTGDLSNYQNYIIEDAGSGINILNLKYLAMQFQDNSKHIYVLIDLDNNPNFDVLVLALRILGHKVVLLRNLIEMSSSISTSKALEYSINSGENEDDFITIKPLRYRLNKDSGWQNNVAEILVFLADNVEQKGAMIFFVTDSVMEKLLKDCNIAKYVQRMSSVQPSHFSDCMAYGWAGDYLSYIGYIYGEDIKEWINLPAECDFSIVIPVRNNAEALKYSIKTCLQIEYDGDYEIVVSDNSDFNDTSVRDLCDEFNDERIKYYRTPFILPLTKSFEFAYLHAKGDFIFSIGADDGVFPWTLKILKILKGYMGECEIIRWKRGFYAWPGFNYGQQNCLAISYPKKPNDIEYSIKTGRSILCDTLADIEGKIYDLPLLYINSGFKRSYFYTLLNKIGRLWDTQSQDVQIGIINVIINKKILCTKMPLTIAGMMAKSIGYTSCCSYDSLQEKSISLLENKNSYQIGAYAAWEIEGFIPYISVDFTLAYTGLLKMYAQKIISEHDLSMVDWKKVYIKLIESVSVHDVSFEYNMSEIRYSAGKWGGEISELVEDWYEKMTRPIRGGKINYSMERAYPVGIFSEIDMINIDGAEFNIKNIEDAIKFISKLLHICDTK